MNSRAQSGPDLRTLGATGLRVTQICIGGSPLGSAEQLYGHGVTEQNAIATVLAAFDGPFNFLDTSNAYGEGRSEQRIGAAIARAGGLPDEFVLATKVDADPTTGAYDGRRVRQSYAESLERLGVSDVPLLHLHDPEASMSFDDAMADGGAVAELVALRAEGSVGSIGIAGGTVDEMLKYVRTGLFDVLLTHNRYTLVDRSAETLIDEASARGMGVLNAAPFGGGLLAGSQGAVPRYAYGMGSEVQLQRAAQMFEAAARADVPLAAAALQFSTRDPRIHSTVVGASVPRRISETAALLEVDIPQPLWDELESLSPGPEHWITM